MRMRALRRTGVCLTLGRAHVHSAVMQIMAMRNDPTMDDRSHWAPDNAAPTCMECGATFTAIRRRYRPLPLPFRSPPPVPLSLPLTKRVARGIVHPSHHCRFCGKLFCGKCASTLIPSEIFGRPPGKAYRAWYARLFPLRPALPCVAGRARAC